MSCSERDFQRAESDNEADNERYYLEGRPQRQLGLERYLIEMHEDLVERTCLANPKIAAVLTKVRTHSPTTDKT